MDLLQLSYFRVVARAEHMTKAAEKLSIAQPSLSKTIRRLEKEIGVPLFDRQGRSIHGKLWYIKNGKCEKRSEEAPNIHHSSSNTTTPHKVRMNRNYDTEILTLRSQAGRFGGLRLPNSSLRKVSELSNLQVHPYVCSALS